jgi:hypothetical protein
MSGILGGKEKKYKTQKLYKKVLRVGATGSGVVLTNPLAGFS